MDTAKGYLRQEQKNLRSTKRLPEQTPDIMTPPESTDPDSGIQENIVYVKVLKVTGKTPKYQTRRLPVTYSRSYKCIRVINDSDSDAILADALESHTETKLL